MQIISILSSKVSVLAATLLMWEVKACPDTTKDLHSTAHFHSVNKIRK